MQFYCEIIERKLTRPTNTWLIYRLQLNSPLHQVVKEVNEFEWQGMYCTLLADVYLSFLVLYFLSNYEVFIIINSTKSTIKILEFLSTKHSASLNIF